jgi:hypothetical protein
MDRDALLLELFDANKVVDAGYRPTVGGGYPDSAQGLVSKDALVYVPGGYTTVGELETRVPVGGLSMVGGARSRRRTRKGRGRGRKGRGRNRSTFKLNLRAQIRLRNRNRSRSQRRH